MPKQTYHSCTWHYIKCDTTYLCYMLLCSISQTFYRLQVMYNITLCGITGHSRHNQRRACIPNIRNVVRYVTVIIDTLGVYITDVICTPWLCHSNNWRYYKTSGISAEFGPLMYIKNTRKTVHCGWLYDFESGIAFSVIFKGSLWRPVNGQFYYDTVQVWI